MLVSETVLLKINCVNSKHYKDLGYVFNYKEPIIVKVSDLTIGSHALVEVRCDFCKESRELTYKDYLRSIKSHNIYCCTKVECYYQKSVLTNIQKRGVSHHMLDESVKQTLYTTNIERYKHKSYSETDECKEKIRKSGLERFGETHISKTQSFQDKLKETRILKGLQLPDSEVEPFKLYRREVDKLTNRVKSKLYSVWSGYDYYDSEYIKDNIIFKFRPSIDHIISVYYGYINNIPASVIADISNLCITKVINNCRKGSKLILIL